MVEEQKAEDLHAAPPWILLDVTARNASLAVTTFMIKQYVLLVNLLSMTFFYDRRFSVCKSCCFCSTLVDGRQNETHGRPQALSMSHDITIII
jgi:hypothetical protein